jgi:hypothetical protein
MDIRTLRRLPALLSLTLLFVAQQAFAQPPTKKSDLADYFGFLPLEIYKLDYRISNLAIRDLDGDKTGDIVVSNNGRSRIDLLLSSKKPDDEQAARPFRKDPNELEYDRRMRLANISVNKEVVSLDIGEFNGDGKPDLVYYGNPAEIEILFNEGQGRFGNPKRINSGEGLNGAAALTVGDFDQDDRDDIVLLADNELVFIYQPSSGVLSEPERIPHTANKPWLVRAVDIDGNGATDLVIVDKDAVHPVLIRFATKEKRLGPEQPFALEVPRSVAFGRIDPGPASEIVVIEQQSGRSKVLALDKSPMSDTKDRGRLVSFALPQGNERGRSLGVGDVDGDHRRDVVVTDPSSAQISLYLQSSSEGLSAGQSFPSLVGARTARLADLDKDGKDEVYVLSEQEKQIGRSVLENGRLTFPSPLPTTGDPVALDIADLDGDKTPEVVYITHKTVVAPSKPTVEVYEFRALARDRATKTFRPYKWGAVDALVVDGITSNPAALQTVDINHDGQLDFFAFNSYGSPVLLLGSKDGPPRPFAGGLGPLASATATALSVVDLNGLGVTVAQGSFARRVQLTADGRWEITDQYNSGRNSSQIVGAAALQTADKGSKEVVLLDRVSKSLLFLAKKDGVYRPAGSLPIGSINYEAMHVADFDGDGRDDLLVAGTDRFVLLESGQKGQRLQPIASYAPKRTETKLSDVAVGDVNSDGVPDLVYIDIGEHAFEILSYAGDKNLVPALSFKIFEHKTYRGAGDLMEPRDLALGDVDGDGRADIVTIIHDRVLVYRQDPGTAPAKPAEKAPVAARSTSN